MLQKVILDLINEKYENPTYKELVEISGLEQTRLFRIKNGTKMRIDEFEILLNLVSDEDCPMQTFLDCYRYLTIDAINEIEREIKRKLILAKLMRGA